MSYESLYDLLKENKISFLDRRREANFEGDLSQVLNNASLALELVLEGDYGTDCIHVARVLYEAPRIVRTAIDYKIEKSLLRGQEIVGPAIKLALGIYQREPGILEKINEYERQLMIDNPELLSRKFVQGWDNTSWLASDPQFSIPTSKRLQEALKGENILFVAIAHGGVGPGMDVFLRYVNDVGAEDSAFYALRYSITKRGDFKPRGTSAEIDELSDLLHGRELVLFDEDSSTGDTIQDARRFLVEKLGVNPTTELNISSSVWGK